MTNEQRQARKVELEKNPSRTVGEQRVLDAIVAYEKSAPQDKEAAGVRIESAETALKAE